MTEEQINQIKTRFDQLLKAQIAPRIPAEGHAPTIFNAKGSDIRKQFALNEPWVKFIKDGLLEFEIEGRTIYLLLQPDKTNPLTIFIQPIAGKAHGEQVTLFLGETPLTPENIGRILHAYLTNETARTECINNNPNYLILPKDLDSDDFLMNSTIRFIPKVLLDDFKDED
jgi:hypothetical protein